MSNPINTVPVTKVGYGETRSYWPIPAVADTYYPGEMIGVATAGANQGYAQHGDDTQAWALLGISATTPRFVVTTDLPASALLLRVDRPRFFSMPLASGTASRLTDIGKPVYAVDSGHVQIGNASGLTYGNLVGYVWDVLPARPEDLTTATGGSVLINPVYQGNGWLPAGQLTRFGAASLGSFFGGFYEEGNLYRLIGNPIAGNSADTTDDILGGIQLPANVFDLAGRGLCITAAGKLGSTADNKRVRIWLNPTMSGQTTTNGVISGGTVSGVGSGLLLYDSGTQAGNAVGWQVMANFFKYGAAGSNTQLSQAYPIFGTTHGGTTVPAFSTLAENAAMNLVVTGASQTSGAANDVVLNFLEVNAMN